MMNQKVLYPRYMRVSWLREKTILQNLAVHCTFGFHMYQSNLKDCRELKSVQ